MRTALSHQPCERLLGNPRRQLIHEGPVTLLRKFFIVHWFKLSFTAEPHGSAVVPTLFKYSPTCCGNVVSSHSLIPEQPQVENIILHYLNF